MQTDDEGRTERYGEKVLKDIGEYKSVERFISRYGKTSSRTAALFHLGRYLAWLRDKKGVGMNPDELILDNLRCVFESKPVDVATKRRHMDWLDEFTNTYLKGKKIVDGSRAVSASMVKQFYERNDSALFGDFAVALDAVRPPPPPLEAQDIRVVMRSLPLQHRLPLIGVWQGGIEINRVLALTWKDIDGKGYPLKLQFFGRKRHRRAYHTYEGRDFVEGLKLWRERWTELQGREPRPEDLIFMGKGGPMARGWLNDNFRETALALHRQGLVKNGDAASWHSHYLRHSFETEGAHAGVPKEIRGFFEGHVKDIAWVYNNSDTIHESDFEKWFLKLEPFVSLEPDRAALQVEFEEREKSLIKRVERAESFLAELKKELGVSQTAPLQAER